MRFLLLLETLLEFSLLFRQLVHLDLKFGVLGGFFLQAVLRFFLHTETLSGLLQGSGFLQGKLGQVLFQKDRSKHMNIGGSTS
jgi:hypothetical protein